MELLHLMLLSCMTEQFRLIVDGSLVLSEMLWVLLYVGH